MEGTCPQCGTKLSTGRHCENICTACHPSWLAYCLGCGNTALHCICRAVAPRPKAEETAQPCGACSTCGTEQIATTRHGEVCPRCQPWVLNACGCGKQIFACICADPGSSE
jgi:hypothetical protein